MVVNNFLKIKTNGQPFTCKFCHAVIWFCDRTSRYYEPDGVTLHVDNCALRKAHYKNEAAGRNEAARQAKRDTL